MEGIPDRRSNLGPSTTIQPPRTTETLFKRRPTPRRKGLNDEVIIYHKGEVVVTFFVVLDIKANTNEPLGEDLSARCLAVD